MPDTVPCHLSWQFGEMAAPDWLPSPVYIVFASFGMIFAGLQVATVLHPEMRTLAHTGLQLVAASDFIQALWWIIVAPQTFGKDAGGWYTKSPAACRGLETIRVGTEAVSIFWTAMLCALVTTAAHQFYNFKAANRRWLLTFVLMCTTLPVMQIVAILSWKLSNDCPNLDDKSSQRLIQQVLTVVYLLITTAATVSVVTVWFFYRMQRRGVAPRLLFFPVSLLVRGIAPLLTTVGWMGTECSTDWAGVWALMLPLLPTASFFVFFFREGMLTWWYKGYYIAVQGYDPAEDDYYVTYSHLQQSQGRTRKPLPALPLPATACDGESESSSLLDIPFAIQQVHLDLLWGFSTQVLLMERRGHRGRHRGRSSVGSSFINSEIGMPGGDDDDDDDNPREVDSLLVGPYDRQPPVDPNAE